MNPMISTTAATMLLSTVASATVGIPVTDVVGITVESVGTGLLDELDPDAGVNRTIRLVATMPEGWRLEAVAGNPEQSLLLQCNGGTFYQNQFGGATSEMVNDAFIAFFPSLQYDSFVTIGALTAEGSPYGQNDLQNIGFDLTTFESEGGAIAGDNGSWFYVPGDGPDGQGEQLPFIDSCDRDRSGVTIAQLTLLGEGATVSFSGLLQVRDDTGVTHQAFFDVFETTPGDRSPVEHRHCTGDLDGDGFVNVEDLLAMLTNWYGDRCIVDLSVDEMVDAVDVVDLISQWGPCPTE